MHLSVNRWYFWWPSSKGLFNNGKLLAHKLFFSPTKLLPKFPRLELETSEMAMTSRDQALRCYQPWGFWPGLAFNWYMNLISLKKDCLPWTLSQLTSKVTHWNLPVVNAHLVGNHMKLYKHPTKFKRGSKITNPSSSQ